MTAEEHDGSVCPECGGLLDVTVEVQGEEMVTIRRTRCETCGRRGEAYS